MDCLALLLRPFRWVGVWGWLTGLPLLNTRTFEKSTSLLAFTLLTLLEFFWASAVQHGRGHVWGMSLFKMVRNHEAGTVDAYDTIRCR